MKSKKLRFFGVSPLILLSVILLCRANLMVKRQADIGGIILEGTAQAIEIMQNGVAMRKQYAITAPGGAGVSSDFAIGSGDSFKAAMQKHEDSSRRKRYSSIGVRSKRQSNFGTENTPENGKNGAIDQIKKLFASAIDVAKEMIAKARESFGNENRKQKTGEGLPSSFGEKFH